MQSVAEQHLVEVAICSPQELVDGLVAAALRQLWGQPTSDSGHVCSTNQRFSGRQCSIYLQCLGIAKALLCIHQVCRRHTVRTVFHHPCHIGRYERLRNWSCKTSERNQSSLVYLVEMLQTFKVRAPVWFAN